MKRLSAIILVVTFAAMSIAISTSAFGDPGTNDLELSSPSISFSGQVVQFKVCNLGSETITNIQYDYNITNVSPKGWLVTAVPSLPSIVGNIDIPTSHWTGSLVSGACISYAVLNDITGNIGDSIAGTISIVSSTIDGGSTNIDDINGNDSVVEGPFTVVAASDLAATTFLTTPGPIHNGDALSYEIDLTNVGVGADPVNSQVIIAFVIPTQATFQSLNYVSGTQSATPLQPCEGGPTSDFGSGLAQRGGYLTFCGFNWDDAFEPGEIAKFVVTMQANQDFESNGVNVVGAVSGADADSMYMNVDMSKGEDPFLRTMNNFFNLTYNSDALQVTINRCEGQSDITIDGTGCFNVEFSKKILASSFLEGDLVLTGGGTVTGFTQISDTIWRVDVAGIEPGSTLALTLGIDSVQDYNAINNDVHVLGENTIRFAIDEPTATSVPDAIGNVQAQGSTSASGVLATTGNNSNIFWVAILLLFLGNMIIGQLSKSRKSAIQCKG